MPLGRSQSETPQKKETSAVSEFLSQSPSSPFGSKSPYDPDSDDPILATLKRSPLKKRNPAMKWDGRVGTMTLKEYRDRKWSVDACYAKVERRGPAFTMRKPLPNFFGKRNTNFSVGDVASSYNRTLPSVPSYTMGLQSFTPSPEKSKGPAEYNIKSTMDPSPHPWIHKNAGARFGSEVLQPRDPTGPAPGDYDPDAIDQSSTLKKPPNFTIQGRESWKAPTAAPGPGVGEFDISKATRVGKDTPLHYTIQGKTEPLEKPLGQRQYESPSPAHYSGPGAGKKSDVYKCQAPIWKFGSEARGLR